MPQLPPQNHSLQRRTLPNRNESRQDLIAKPLFINASKSFGHGQEYGQVLERILISCNCLSALRARAISRSAMLIWAVALLLRACMSSGAYSELYRKNEWQRRKPKALYMCDNSACDSPTANQR